MLIFRIFVALLYTLFSSVSISQIANAELDDACRGDIELTEYVVQTIQGEVTSSSEYLTSEEVVQINAILDDETNANLSVSNTLAMVLDACANGAILQQRNAHFINSQ